MYVSSFQMYIEIYSPKIEFLLANGTTTYTIQNTGNYVGQSLQTFAVPNIDLSQVTQVRISSTSTINPNITVYGVKFASSQLTAPNPLLCNLTFDSLAAQLFNNSLSSPSNYVNTSVSITQANTVISQGLFNVTYNYKPFYVTIPSITFSGVTGPSLQFSFVLTSGNNSVTTTFTLQTNAGGYTNLAIPLQIPNPPETASGIAFTVTNPVTTYSPPTNNIAATLTCTSTSTTIQVVTKANLSSGMVMVVYGTSITIDPTLTPSTLTVASPVTFSSSKDVMFSSIAATTAANATIPVTYTLYPNPTIATYNSPGTLGPTSFRLSNSSSDVGTITIYANSQGITGYNPKSIYAQTTVKNYATLASGRVVPFANTYNHSIMIYSGTSYAAKMYINFTQNVTLNSLDFGYIFSNFIPSTNVTNGGYSGSNNPTFYVNITNSNSSEPSALYGSFSFTCKSNESGGVNYTAIYSSTSNANASNDGTLLSIPFTNALSPLPTYVTSFSGSSPPFAFNIGDQICITLSCNNPGTYISTPYSSNTTGLLQSNGFTSFGELCGSLVCTPNTTGNPTYNPVPTAVSINISNGGTQSSTASTVSTFTMNITGKTILTGFQLTGISMSPVGTTTYPAAPQSLRADIYKNNVVIFQVFFQYVETSSSTNLLYIPFSYAEYARVASIDSSLVSRIVPTSVFFNQPQNPIFNVNDTFKMIVANNLNTMSISMAVYSSGSGNAWAAGLLNGINLNLPTITFTAENVPITPVFNNYGGPNKTFIIPKPTSTSTGGFIYTVQTNAGTTVSPSDQNCSLTLYSGNNYFNSLVTINAYQQSTTTYSKINAVYPNTINFINTNPSSYFLYSAYAASPSSINASGNQMVFNTVLAEDTVVQGFSFQYFGGYSESTTTPRDHVFNVIVTTIDANGNGTVSQRFDISYTTTRTDLVDGSMIFVPFYSSLINTPTYVSKLLFQNPNGTASNGITNPVAKRSMISITYTNSGGCFVYGTQVSLSVGGVPASSSVTVNCLLGSLVTTTPPASVLRVDSTTYTYSGVSTPNMGGTSYTTIFSDSFVNIWPNKNSIMLLSIYISYIQFQNVPTVSSPQTLVFRVMVTSTTGYILYRCEITARFTSNPVQPYVFPLNMPAPGSPLSSTDNTSGYTITNVESNYYVNQAYGVNYNGSVSLSYPVFGSVAANPNGSQGPPNIWVGVQNPYGNQFTFGPINTVPPSSPMSSLNYVLMA